MGGIDLSRTAVVVVLVWRLVLGASPRTGESGRPQSFRAVAYRSWLGVVDSGRAPGREDLGRRCLDSWELGLESDAV